MILPLLAEMSGSIHVGLAAMGVGIGIGLTGMGMATAVGRNPGAFTPVLVHGTLAIEFTEAIVFYALFLLPHLEFPGGSATPTRMTNKHELAIGPFGRRVRR